VRRALAFVKTFDEYVQDGIILDSASFHLAMRLVSLDDEDDDDSLPHSMAAQFDDDVAIKEVIESLPRLDPDTYDRRRLHRALTADIDALTEIWFAIRGIGFADDAKLQQFKNLLQTELKGQKLLIFTYYKDTARYLYEGLTRDDSSEWLAAMGQPTIRRIDSGNSPKDRVRLVERFAPIASGYPEIRGTDEEIDILVSTDVLSEGQNLQDCGYLINYDLHWNPTRMVQRAGRIDRLGSSFDVLTIFNMFPERALEELLGLVRSLTSKIEVINQTGFLDASVLGEVVTPRDFNTLRRIAEEDNTVIEEQESFLELASSEALLAELQKVLATEAARWLTDLDDGIHSGLERQETQGIFFYYTAPHPEDGRYHFWRYYDVNRREIIDNRYQIMQIIACGPETPRFPPSYDEINVFDLQEKVIADILGEVEQQQAAEIVTKPVAEEQAIVSQILRQQLHNPVYDRTEIRDLRKFLKQPLVGASVQKLREVMKIYSTANKLEPLLEAVRELYQQQGQIKVDEPRQRSRLSRDDLHLICFEYICQ
jgi:hypothetical protein